MENHYQTLNVQYGDSVEIIKASYRRLAMRWHPDKNLYDPHAETKFKLILRAYQVLSGPERQKYDIEYLKVFRKNQHSKPYQYSKFNHYAEDDIYHDWRDAAQPNYTSNEILKQVRVKVSLDFWDAVLGCTKTYQIKDPYTNNIISVDVKFPPGVSDSDIYFVTSHLRKIEFHVTTLKDEYFSRDGLDIYSHFDVPFATATSGGSLHYPYWSGNLVLQIPTGFQHGQSIKIEGKGIHKNGKSGDLYLKGKIIVPMNITTAQKELIQKFQKIEEEKGKPSPLFKFLHELWKKK